jgi:hypothetical protein
MKTLKLVVRKRYSETPLLIHVQAKSALRKAAGSAEPPASRSAMCRSTVEVVLHFAPI